MTKALHPDETDPGGRIHFSSAGRSLIEEDQIELTSVGVDIGSSTSHFLISAIRLERLDTRYVVTGREVRFSSAILLTPYAGDNTIDAEALGGFIADEFRRAAIAPEEVDTGALILTGVAARRRNARAIGEIFAAQAGKFVSVSAGDALEALMAAHGSGAARLSETHGAVLNIDIGGGTTKLALCRNGEVVARTALDAGARLVVIGPGGRIERIEPFGAHHIAASGADARLGEVLAPDARGRIARHMAEAIMAAAGGAGAAGLMRLPALALGGVDCPIVFSGGVSEFLAGDCGDSGDLGPDLARELALKVAQGGRTVLPARQGIRATVVGASQYTVQVSGSTIFLDPETALPLRNLAVIAPDLALGDEIRAEEVASAIAAALARLDLESGDAPVAIALPWRGSASYARLSALARGIVAGLSPVLSKGHPLVIVCDGDVGGLIGMQCRSEENVPGPVVSIDGIALAEFDFIDIGAVLRATGATPVVVKSLVFPTE